MNLTVAIVALCCGIAVWALAVSRLTAKSWETQGAPALEPPTGLARMPAAKIGLFVFLCVVTSLFGLFIAAYNIRMGTLLGVGHGVGNWNSIPEPPILWVNTALLLLASVAMQACRRASLQGRRSATWNGLLAAGVLSAAFIVGQLFAWGEVSEYPFVVAGNPASTFFYLLTAVHALHILGGLYVWMKTAARLGKPGAEPSDVALGVELCAIYWHFLFFVWLVLFALLLYT